MPSNFEHSEMHLAHNDARTLLTAVSAVSDLALVIDPENVIKDVTHNLDHPFGSAVGAWRGRTVEDVVHDDSRTTLRKMLRSAREGGMAKRFDVRHLIEGARDLPVRYTALGAVDGGLLLAGLDLRSLGDLQSRLYESRQALESSNRNQRHAEAHYRLLFETAEDALVVLDASTGKVREANGQAAALLGMSPTAIAGKRLPLLFDKSLRSDIQALLAGVAASGTSVGMTLGGAKGPMHVSMDLFRAGDVALVMVRLKSEDRAGRDAKVEPSLESLVRGASEAVVLADETGMIVWANESFLTLAGIPLAAHAVGKSLDVFFTWSTLESELLLQNVRRHGRVSAVSGKVKGPDGRSTDVEVSAVFIQDGTPGFGFVMRSEPPREQRPLSANSDLTRTAEKLVEMVGSVPMKDLVRDTTDVIEKMCIEAALKLSGNNRASAARALGLSRQALYLKMGRFGIVADDLSDDA